MTVLETETGYAARLANDLALSGEAPACRVEDELTVTV